jgi:hypothetical protein
VKDVNDIHQFGFDQIENEIVTKNPTADAGTLMAGNKRESKGLSPISIARMRSSRTISRARNGLSFAM